MCHSWNLSTSHAQACLPITGSMRQEAKQCGKPILPDHRIEIHCWFCTSLFASILFCSRLATFCWLSASSWQRLASRRVRFNLPFLDSCSRVRAALKNAADCFSVPPAATTSHEQMHTAVRICIVIPHLQMPVKHADDSLRLHTCPKLHVQAASGATPTEKKTPATLHSRTFFGCSGTSMWLTVAALPLFHRCTACRP